MSTCRELILMGKAERMLAEASTIDELTNIRDDAQAIVLWGKKKALSDKIVVRAAALKVQAERKIGELLKSSTLAKGAPGNQYTGKLVRSHGATGPLRLRHAVLTKSESSRCQQIASLSPATFNRYVTQCVKSGQGPTTAGLLRLIKQQSANGTVVANSVLSAGFYTDLEPLIATGQRFATIYADPPCKYDNQATRAATDNHYPTMTVEQIAAEPVAQLAADNCHLHLWTTNAFLPAAFSVIAARGFTYKSCVIWVKPTLGIGNYWRVSHGFLLLAVRGNLPFQDRGQRSWIELERRGHSCKPEEVRTLIERVSPGPYLELYGRVIPPSPGWTVYGNQLLKATN